MIKLVFTLAAALYAGFVIWGHPTDVVAPEKQGAVSIAADAAEFDRPVILQNASSPEPHVTRAVASEALVPDAAAIAASAPAPAGSFPEPRLIGEPLVVSLVEPRDAPEATAEPTAERMLRVTGSRVNMRAGPSTANRVVDSLPQGTLAEPLGPPEGGWQEIRDIATGRTGFMSARFLEPAV
ncbi:SH3 domain-containing protein [Jannaschia sp. S6380]|uniref:SH3 domain-containing protein n=1 Tax=Jannaschia sp. S6380 TaxID=2926408 RepID=UPI001FF2E771|nr:SH3 domain-containing protein [Jannaschia sp. S6380]MCK0169408.1 SH3 domain-containing protein [Jannaschia sp. S6380]